MKKILHLLSSANLKNSTSRAVGGHFVGELVRAKGSLNVVRRDLVLNPPPHIGPEFIASLAEHGSEALAHSRELLGELLDAGLLVIESPMYNFTVPSTLKAWFDHIVRPGMTFKYGPNGREGLLTSTRAVLILSSGDVYSDSPAKGLDHQDTWLRTILGYIGVADIQTIRIEGTARGDGRLQQSLAAARVQVDEIIKSL